jgi:transposase
MADGGVCEDREAFWRAHLAGWKSSGLSLRVYSEQHGLKAGTLGYWNSRLKAEPVDVPASVAKSGAEPSFLAVHVAGPAEPGPVEERIELVLPGGWRVRVGRDFEAATLHRLLDVLERRS